MLFCLLGFFYCCVLASGIQAAHAQVLPEQRVERSLPAWRLQTITTRTEYSGKQVTMPLAVAAPVGNSPSHVVLYFSSFPDPQIVSDQNGVRMLFASPWISAASNLNALGVVVAVADVPSDASERRLTQRPLPDIRADISAAIRELNVDFPGLPVHLAGSGPDAGELITASAVLPAVKRLVFASSDFRRYRTNDWKAMTRPVLIVQAPSAQCDGMSYTDTAFVARRNNFQMVAAGYRQQERNSNCRPGSQTALTGLESEFAALIVQWLNGGQIPGIIGFTGVQLAWREQVMRYLVPNSPGAELRELTVLYPTGTGPFPVMVFNHGDVEPESPWVEFRQRMVNMVVAREFLNFGWAVAFPSRMGVGFSDGLYSIEQVRDDFNPTYKAQVHASEIAPVLQYLPRLPLLDMRRVVLGGQSAGGYAVMYLAGMNLPGVVGVINFSGGRTDAGTYTPPPYTLTKTETVRKTSGLTSRETTTVSKTQIRRSPVNVPASQMNQIMIDGFAEFGKTSRVPGLWLFAENDSRYSATTIREAHKAFTQAGGQATLLLFPASMDDGHFIYQSPELWRPALRNYLQSLGTASLN